MAARDPSKVKHFSDQVGTPSAISFDHYLFSNGKMIGTKICPVNKLSSFKGFQS